MLLRGGMRSATFGLGFCSRWQVATPGQVRLSIHRLRRRIHRQLADSLDPSPPARPAGRDGRPQPHAVHRRSRSPATGPLARNYSNYLSPRLGFFSADSWTLLGIYLRNLALNWMVLLPLLMVPLLGPRWIIAFTQLNLERHLPGWANPALFMVGLRLCRHRVDLSAPLPSPLREYRRDSWLQTLETQAWFLRACLAPLILSVGCLTTAWAWFRNNGGTLDQITVGQTVLGGAFLHTGSWLFSAITLTRFKAMTKWLVWETLAVAATGALGGFFLRGALAGCCRTAQGWHSLPNGSPSSRCLGSWLSSC